MDKITLNEKTYTQEEFQAKKKKLESKPGVKVVEVKPGVFRSQIRG